MHWLSQFLTDIRPILESVYFVSAIALAIFVLIGLKQLRLTLEQLKLTREIAKTNAKRESYKLAAEQCRYFAEEVLKYSNELASECRTKNITIFKNAKFKIVQGEIREHNFPEAGVVAPELLKCMDSLLKFLNRIEAFSIFVHQELPKNR